jgi:undecaprenyl-diphosphatase
MDRWHALILLLPDFFIYSIFSDTLTSTANVNPFVAVLLGIIQGLTEFLPISSTAHLTLAGRFLNLVSVEHPESWTDFIAVMQLGTVAAVILYFWKDIVKITRGFFRDLLSWGGGKGVSGFGPDGRMALVVLIGSLPVGILGFLLKHLIEGSLTKNIGVIAASMLILALMLWLAERIASHQRPIESITWRDAVIVGLGQTLALIPGSSRSGTTITVGLFLGLTRDAAARFSFLLSIPAVLASGFYELSKVQAVGELGLVNLLIATIVSGIVGYAAIAWLLRYLMRHTTMVFVWYRMGLGFLLVYLLVSGLIVQ